MNAKERYEKHPISLLVHDPRVKQSIIELMEEHAEPFKKRIAELEWTRDMLEKQVKFFIDEPPMWEQEQ